MHSAKMLLQDVCPSVCHTPVTCRRVAAILVFLHQGAIPMALNNP